MHDTTQEEIPMTKEEFQKLTQNVVLLDGATGSNLMAAGMPRGICTEAWIMDHKEILQNLFVIHDPCLCTDSPWHTGCHKIRTGSAVKQYDILCQFLKFFFCHGNFLLCCIVHLPFVCNGYGSFRDR